MNKSFAIIDAPAQTVAKRMFYLAWKASSVIGMGALQDRGHQSEDSVWHNITRAGDYSFDGVTPPNVPKSYAPEADYVFGRMMKMDLNLTETAITFYDSKLREDYQSWCRSYPSYPTLLHAACKELGCNYVAL